MSEMDTSLDAQHSVTELEARILADKLNMDNMNTLVELSDSQDGDIKFAAQQAMGRVFINFIDSRFLNPKKSSMVGGELTPEAQFKNWLLDIFYSYRGNLVNSICHSCDHLADLHDTSIQLVRSESAITGNISSFTIDKIVSKLISKQPNTKPLFQLFEKDLQFCDVIYCSLCTLRRCLTPGKGNRYSHENILQLMLSIQRHLPQNPNEYKYLVKSDTKHTGKNDFLKLISKLWVQFLSYDMTQDTLILVLRVMDTDILPNLSEPRLLLDFLTRSLDAGGELSILSLKSLVILIHKHKLEYPRLYTKIYSLLTPDLTRSEDYGDFLALFDMVTTSSHLPQYVVAAYMKRLASISLHAPPHSIRPILVIISNLVARHPNCAVMLHRGDREYPDGDPYLPQEEDPMKCRAIESCLWELVTLKHHYCRETAALVTKLFNSSVKMKERSVTAYIETPEQELDRLSEQCIKEIVNGKFSCKKPEKEFPFPSKTKSKPE